MCEVAIVRRCTAAVPSCCISSSIAYTPAARRYATATVAYASVRRPYASFGNSTGDQQMLEYTGAGDGARLALLVLHDDATREYAHGPAQGLPNTKVGTFTS